MSKRRQKPRKGGPRQRMADSSAGPRSKANGRQGVLLRGRRLWILRFAVLLGGPVVFLALLEGSLSLCGVGYPTSFFIRSERPGFLTTNARFGWHYQQETLAEPQPCLLPVDKSDDAIRIFVLGESAAVGTPDPSFGFVRILEIMLGQRFPARRIEVVNAAMRGINSHVITQIAKECAGLNPDLFVLYSGNNELNGLYAPKTSASFFGRHPALIPAFHYIKRTRTGQMLRRVLGLNPEARRNRKRTADAAFFQSCRTALDDPQRDHVYRNFRTNLERICRRGLEAGADVIVSTVGVNLREFPPLASLHRADLSPPQQQQWEQHYRRGIGFETARDTSQAVSSYQKALEIDDHHAEVHFRMAGCRLRAGEMEEAARHFALARDWDALQFRADSRINGTIHEVVDMFAGGYAELQERERDTPVRLVEIDRALAESELCPDGIPGSEFFYEHVHLRFAGDYHVARAMLPAIVEVLERRGISATEAALPTMEQCARQLAFTRWDAVNTAAAMLQLTAKPPFNSQLGHASRQAAGEKAVAAVMDRVDEQFVNEVLQDYHEAIAAEPEDWILRYNLGTFLHQLERSQEAASCFDEVVRTMPDFAAFRVLLGYALAKAGRVEEAVRQFREALKRDAHCEEARQGLAWARKMKQARR